MVAVLNGRELRRADEVVPELDALLWVAACAVALVQADTPRTRRQLADAVNNLTAADVKTT